MSVGGRPRLLVALDFPGAEEAVRTARRVEAHVDGFKVGLELLMGPGPGVVAAVAEIGKPVFCDAKLHDIPNTVAAATRQLGRLGARWVTAHASGGTEMMRAAVAGFTETADVPAAGVIAITVLTSMDESMLASLGTADSLGRHVGRLAKLAAGAGVEGVVCSVREIGTVRQVSDQLLVATPGIRPEGYAADDQARTATPDEAARRGADLVIVGRPITRAADPAEAASRIAARMGGSGGGALVESPSG